MERKDWKEKFLETLAQTGNVSKSAKKVGITRRRAYQVRHEDTEFSTLWDEAIEIAADALEEEARRRAVTGVLDPVFYKGDKVGAIRKYSDVLLIVLLKATRPEKYRERFEHTGKDGEPLAIKAYVSISPDDWDEPTSGQQ